MARMTVVTTTDDIDGTEGATTRFFAIGESAYAIDLSDQNNAAFMASLVKYIDCGARVGKFDPFAGQGSGKKRALPSEGRLDPKVVRAWAKQHGYQVSDRGRVAAEVVQAYTAALRS